jgi:hypothetical protein
VQSVAHCNNSAGTKLIHNFSFLKIVKIEPINKV